MRNERILETMSCLDPALVEEAAVFRKKRRFRMTRLIPIAACLALVLITAAAAVRYGKIWLNNIGGGYSVGYDLTLYQTEDLGEELQNFYTNSWDPEAYQAYDPLTGNYDGSGYVTSYATLEEAEEFVRVPLRNNPLLRDGLNDRVSVDANVWVTVRGSSAVDGQDFDWSADICLENYGTLVQNDVVDSDVNYRSEEYQMANGETAIIVSSDTGDYYESSVWHASYAYFVADGILYTVSFGDGGIPENNEASTTLLYEVLDAFA